MGHTLTATQQLVPGGMTPILHFWAIVAVDARHADLHRRREELEATLQALRDAATLPSLLQIDAKRPRWRRALYVGEAARHVGMPVSTVRFWEKQELLRLRRDPESHYRLYDAEHVRALQVIALLREGGYDAEARPIDRGERSVLG